MNLEEIADICAGFKAEMLVNEPMAQYTTFRIGGPCDCMVKVNCKECFAETVKYCRENDIPYYIVGKGSNILVSDKGLRGVVILISSAFSNVTVDGERIICDAGAPMSKICVAARDNCLTGIEFAYGIPGTAGGALYMNAGAYGGEMCHVVESAEYLDENGNIKEIALENMNLSYRHSIFSENNYPIVSVTIKLEKGEYDKISDRMNYLMERRRTAQPLEFPSAGSTFKRPEGDFAARLIDVCGLKGTACGGAEVSTKHSGFIINKNNATFNDVLGVVDTVKKKVYADTGIMLECEVLILE